QIQKTLVMKVGSDGMLRSASAAAAIFSNGAQVVGLALALTGQPRSLGRITWYFWFGSFSVLSDVLLFPNSVPLILTLYQVACTSSPRRRANCGASSNPRL